MFKSLSLIVMLMLGLTGNIALANSILSLSDDHLNFTPRSSKTHARIDAVVAPSQQFDTAERFERRPAGAATVRLHKKNRAFSQASGNISFEKELDFKVGNGLFRKLWVSSPASTIASDGLGPLYNARACQRCHIKDGRGHPPEGPEDNPISMLLRVSIPGNETSASTEITEYLATLPEPTYGRQLQDFSIAGQPSEYRLKITYSEFDVPLSEGETARLRSPSYHTANLGYGALHPATMISPRVAPQMIGLGLLEAIPVKDILANADPDDQNGDGVSGRPNIVWSLEYDKPMLGRFGLKAGNPTLWQQAADAFAGDIGISNPLFPEPWGECTVNQPDCRRALHGDHPAQGGYEIDYDAMELVTYYTRNLAVPVRRNIDDPQVLRGKQIFYQTGCIACHTPKYVTHRLPDRPEQSFQLIWPYSDLLLHDMGDGLADHMPEARATGREWRTPPLWGIGLTQQVSGHSYFLHDGRARSLLEAVLWHGGEAKASREAVITMPKDDRDALLQFLESL
jgi:CxxC motif-containing protein (DUF1111 family)